MLSTSKCIRNTNKPGSVLPMKLTQSQAIFLRMVQGGSATSNRNNKTAQSLKKLGLVQFNAGLGWSLTPIGVLKLNEMKGN